MGEHRVPEEHVSTIRCPRCGGTSKFWLIERADVSRAVTGVDPNGYVEIHDEPTIETGPLAVEARFHCHNLHNEATCNHRWTLPAWLVRRLVYY